MRGGSPDLPRTRFDASGPVSMRQVTHRQSVPRPACHAPAFRCLSEGRMLRQCAHRPKAAHEHSGVGFGRVTVSIPGLCGVGLGRASTSDPGSFRCRFPESRDRALPLAALCLRIGDASSDPDDSTHRGSDRRSAPTRDRGRTSPAGSRACREYAHRFRAPAHRRCSATALDRRRMGRTRRQDARIDGRTGGDRLVRLMPVRVVARAVAGTRSRSADCTTASARTESPASPERTISAPGARRPRRRPRPESVLHPPV